MLNVAASIRNQSLRAAEAQRLEQIEAVADNVLAILDSNKEDFLIPWIVQAAPTVDARDGHLVFLLGVYDGRIHIASTFRYTDTRERPIFEIGTIEEVLGDMSQSDLKWSLAHLRELINRPMNQMFREWEANGLFSASQLVPENEMEFAPVFPDGIG